MISPGSSIGNYRILSPLSSDAVSQVYLADSLQAQSSPVAIRIWYTLRLASAQEYQAFMAEAQDLIRLRHPFLLSTLDAGVIGETPYIVTEYMYSTQGTLQERIQRQMPQPFPESEALTILSQMGQALGYAHQHMILHRQLSPEHILFNNQGEALLADFGLPTILEALLATVPNSRGQSAADAYLAPEQMSSIVNKSKLSDQYALGAIAYVLLTGYPPTHPPIAPTQRNSFLPASIEAAILQAMAQQPMQRFPSIQAFLTALQNIPITTPYSPQEQVVLPLPEYREPMQAVHMGNTDTLQPQYEQWGMPAPPQFPTSPAPIQKQPRQNRRPLLIALLVLLLLGLSALGVYGYTLLPASSAVVTITPKSQHVHNTYSVAVVASNPDATQGQIAAHIVSFTSKSQSKTVAATGKGHQDATSATGTLMFSNVGQNTTIGSGQVISGNSGVQIVTDEQFGIAVGATITIKAHAQATGPGGNIPAFDINNTYNVVDSITKQFKTTVDIQNTADFTGGQDAFDYTFVQQSDVDNATTSMTQQLTSETQAGVQQAIPQNAKTIGTPQCTPTAKPNPAVNAHATSVTIQVTVTCKQETYMDQEVQAMAVTLLKADALKSLGTNYALIGNAHTDTPILGTVDSSGTAPLTVKADSIWAFQFSDTDKQHIAQAIAGKSQAESSSLLQKMAGIHTVSMQTSGFGNALPSSSSNITLTIVPVQGLTT